MKLASLPALLALLAVGANAQQPPSGMQRRSTEMPPPPEVLNGTGPRSVTRTIAQIPALPTFQAANDDEIRLLLKAQTEAIKTLSARIDTLESRLHDMEKKGR